MQDQFQPGFCQLSPVNDSILETSDKLIGKIKYFSLLVPLSCSLNLL